MYMYVWRKYSQTTTKTLVYLLRLQIEKRGDLTVPLTTQNLVSEQLDYIHTMEFVSKYLNLNCFKYNVLQIQMYNVYNSAWFWLWLWTVEQVLGNRNHYIMYIQANQGAALWMSW